MAFESVSSLTFSASAAACFACSHDIMRRPWEFAAVIEISDTTVTDDILRTFAVPLRLCLAPHLAQRLDCRYFNPRLLCWNLAVASHPCDCFGSGQRILGCLPVLAAARQPLFIPSANHRR